MNNNNNNNFDYSPITLTEVIGLLRPYCIVSFRDEYDETIYPFKGYIDEQMTVSTLLKMEDETDKWEVLELEFNNNASTYILTLVKGEEKSVEEKDDDDDENNNNDNYLNFNIHIEMFLNDYKGKI